MLYFLNISTFKQPSRFLNALRPNMTLYRSRKYACAKYFDRLLFKVLQKYLEVKRGHRVLEIGCNRGGLVQKMQKMGAVARGVDVNPEAIANGFTNTLSIMDAMHLDFPDASFDQVYSVHTIEHIPNIQKAFKEMERVLKPNGKLVLVYPAEPWLLRGFLALKSALFAYRNPFLARRIHLHSVTPAKLKHLAAQTSLVYRESKFPVLLYPQYLTVFVKRPPVR